MISLSEHQKREFRKLSQLLLESVTEQEIIFYSDKIHQVLDEGEVKGTIFNDAQLKQYKEYKQALLNAHNDQEISYYEKKIMNLIDNSKVSPT